MLLSEGVTSWKTQTAGRAALHVDMEAAAAEAAVVLKEIGQAPPRPTPQPPKQKARRAEKA